MIMENLKTQGYQNMAEFIMEDATTVEDVKQAKQTVLRLIKILHENNIVHGDTVFSNIMVQSPDNIRLIDYGASHQFQDNKQFKKISRN